MENQKMNLNQQMQSKSETIVNDECDHDDSDDKTQLELTKKIEKTKQSNKSSSRNYKRQIRKQMILFENKRNQNLQCQYQFINSQYFECYFTTQKFFLLEGGLCVEIVSKESDEYQSQLMEKMKLIQSALKFNDGSVQIDLSDKIAKDSFDYVIRLLQSTQNRQDYDLSLKLVLAKDQVLELKTEIDKVISFYDVNTFEQIIQYRKNFVVNFMKKMKSYYLKQDDFGIIVPYCINWQNKQMYSSSCIVSQPLIALLGTNSDGFVNYVMRQKFNWMNSQSRRQLTVKNLDFFTSKGAKRNQEFFLDDFESIMIDNILIKSQCKFQIKGIDYPPQLQFYGPGINQVNQIDSILILKLCITEEHLEKIMNIRQNSEFNLQNQSIFEDDTQFIADNFEYYMQSQVFLEKFYNKSDKSIESNVDKCELNNRCNYRYIDQACC